MDAVAAGSMAAGTTGQRDAIDAGISISDAGVARSSANDAASPAQPAMNQLQDAAVTPIATAGASGPALPSMPVSMMRDASTPQPMPKPVDASTPPSMPMPVDASMPQPMPKPVDASTPPSMPMPVDAGSPNSSAGRGGAASMPAGCTAGVYAGTFSGTLRSAGVVVSTVTGTVNGILDLARSGQYLIFRDLRAVGADESGNTVTVTLAGNINCSTFQLEAGRLTDGTYYNASTRAALPFVGVAQGMYTTGRNAVDGTWTVEAGGSSSRVGGDGEFSFALTP